MKKAIPVFAFLILTAIAETMAQEISTVMYVNAPMGLPVRSSPDIDGKIVGTLAHMTELRVIRAHNSIVTIDGVTGRWIYVATENTAGWVFEDYLTSTNAYTTGTTAGTETGTAQNSTTETATRQTGLQNPQDTEDVH
jgi:hypothetical protein